MARAARPAPDPPAIVDLDTDLAHSGLPGARVLGRVGPRIGLRTIGDLLFHLPRDHRDLRALATVAEIRWMADKAQASALLRVEEISRRHVGSGRRITLTEARLSDATGSITATWFGDRRFIERQLRPGDTALFSGRVRAQGRMPSLSDPEFQRADAGEPLHAGRMVPVYRLTDGLSARVLRGAMRAAIETAGSQLPETLPPDLREGLPGLRWAVSQLHYPDDPAALEAARTRLAFEELLALQVGMVARKRLRADQDVPPIGVSDAVWDAAIAGVERGIAAGLQPTEDGSRPERAPLTDDQRLALAAMREDLASGRPMMRLIQGDVGSGKTAVAAVAMAVVAGMGHQSALLAPTDLLARQHAATLGRLLEPLGHGVVLMSGSASAAERREAREAALQPSTALLGATRGLVFVGTHALIQESVAFHDLRLAVIDEQHRFGVADREALESKGARPHVLLMTATPIPRTLGQVVHADLDVSDIRAAPSGRLPVRTGIRRPEELVMRGDGRPGPLVFLVREVAASRRGFVIVPLVHPPEPDPDVPPPPGPQPTHVDAAVALITEAWPEAARAAGNPDLPLRLGVVHGQMRVADRDAAMARFRGGELDVLVGTTVLEVGVDVPDATVMIILDADRFGIAQLHQLRGRVGRGRARAGCILVSAAYPDASMRDADLEPAALLVRRRLDAVAGSSDGFELAELDLELRREGDLLGLEQSGLPPLRVARLSVGADRDLSLRARRVAEEQLDAAGRLPERLAAFGRELQHGWLRRVGAGDVVSGDEIDG